MTILKNIFLTPHHPLVREAITPKEQTTSVSQSTTKVAQQAISTPAKWLHKQVTRRNIMRVMLPALGVISLGAYAIWKRRPLNSKEIIFHESALCSSHDQLLNRAIPQDRAEQRQLESFAHFLKKTLNEPTAGKGIHFDLISHEGKKSGKHGGPKIFTRPMTDLGSVEKPTRAQRAEQACSLALTRRQPAGIDLTDPHWSGPKKIDDAEIETLDFDLLPLELQNKRNEEKDLVSPASVLPAFSNETSNIHPLTGSNIRISKKNTQVATCGKKVTAVVSGIGFFVGILWANGKFNTRFMKKAIQRIKEDSGQLWNHYQPLQSLKQYWKRGWKKDLKKLQRQLPPWIGDFPSIQNMHMRLPFPASITLPSLKRLPSFQHPTSSSKNGDGDQGVVDKIIKDTQVDPALPPDFDTQIEELQNAKPRSPARQNRLQELDQDTILDLQRMALLVAQIDLDEARAFALIQTYPHLRKIHGIAERYYKKEERQ